MCCAVWWPVLEVSSTRQPLRLAFCWYCFHLLTLVLSLFVFWFIGCSDDLYCSSWVDGWDFCLGSVMSSSWAFSRHGVGLWCTCLVCEREQEQFNIVVEIKWVVSNTVVSIYYLTPGMSCAYGNRTQLWYFTHSIGAASVFFLDKCVSDIHHHAVGCELVLLNILCFWHCRIKKRPIRAVFVVNGFQRVWRSWKLLYCMFD